MAVWLKGAVTAAADRQPVPLTWCVHVHMCGTDQCCNTVAGIYNHVQCLDWTCCPGSPVLVFYEWGSGCAGEGGPCRPLDWLTDSPCVRSRHTQSDEAAFWWLSYSAEVRNSFQETPPRKTAENTVKHRDGGVGSVVANHRGGGESSVVVTTTVLIFHDRKPYTLLRVVIYIEINAVEMPLLSSMWLMM